MINELVKGKSRMLVCML